MKFRKVQYYDTLTIDDNYFTQTTTNTILNNNYYAPNTMNSIFYSEYWTRSMLNTLFNDYNATTFTSVSNTYYDKNIYSFHIL